MRSTELCRKCARPANISANPKLDTGPAIVVKNSAAGVLELDCAISETPPNMNSVICLTLTPSRRATKQWQSSCSNTQANRPMELMVPAVQYVNRELSGTCRG